MLVKKLNVPTLMVLLDKAFPPDIRIEKELMCIKEFNVGKITLLTLLNGKKDTTWNGINVKRIKKADSSSAFIKYASVVIREFFSFPKIIFHKKVNVIHVHDLPYAVPTALIGKLFRKKVIFDMHEHYVDMISPLFLTYGRVGKALLKVLHVLEAMICRLVDVVIVVAKESKERLIEMGIDAKKIHVIPNYANIKALNELIEEIKNAPNLFDDNDKNIKIVYVGGITYERGLETLVKAVGILRDKGVTNFKVYIVGDGYVLPTLKEMTKELKLEKFIIFTGWIPYKEAMKHVYYGDIGIAPSKNTPQSNVILPHKLFQYMFFGKPIIVSSVKPLKRIVSKNNCGLIFEADNPIDLANKIMYAINNIDKIKDLGQNGKKAVLEKYNITTMMKKLFRVYSILSEKS